MAIGDWELIKEVIPYTKSSPERLVGMIAAIRQVDANNIAGDIVECGVWRGGNIIIARKLSPRRICWLYDTFTGMTEPGEHDVGRKGQSAWQIYHGKKRGGLTWAAASLAEVADNLETMGVLDHRYLRFVPGAVEHTLLEPSNLPTEIALLRLDTDWYASTKVELEVLYPRLQAGGILIVDDYGHWMGAQRAVNQYFGNNRPKMSKLDYTAIQIVK